MCGLFDLVSISEIDGRQIMHLESEDPARDIAELSQWLLDHYEVIVGKHSIYLLEKFPALAT